MFEPAFRVLALDADESGAHILAITHADRSLYTWSDGTLALHSRNVSDADW